MSKLFHDVEPSELEEGDHIYVYRWFGMYCHHGIVVKLGPTLEDIRVIHHMPPKKGTDGRTIHLVTLEQFSLGCRVRKVEYGEDPMWVRLKRSGTSHEAPSHRPQEVTARAWRGFEEGKAGYHWMNHNCEDFAYFCKTGDRTRWGDGSLDAPAGVEYGG